MRSRIGDARPERLAAAAAMGKTGVARVTDKDISRAGGLTEMIEQLRRHSLLNRKAVRLQFASKILFFRPTAVVSAFDARSLRERRE